MSVLTPAQETFAAKLAGATGLDRNVIRGWTLAEESSGAAQKRVAQNNHNWLNIGYFDSGAGSLTRNADWSDPVRAAAATAAFLKGQKYGASSGIRGILGYAGKSPQEQIAAIAKSGWASSGYGGGANLLKTYGLVSGVAAPPGALASSGATTTPPGKPSTIPAPGGSRQGRSLTSAASAILNAKTPTAALGQLNAGVQLQVQASPSVQAQGVSPNAAGIVAEAKKYLGTKYVWGGTTPQGFDCSGFLQYVWKQKGVNISRTTYTQIKEGVEVPISKLQAGDAVFFGSHDSPHHVGMYIGHGQFIEAPHTGAVVRISNLNDRLGDFAQARRFGS